MATPTTTAPPARQLDERELRAWRGLLRAHAALTKALDAELDAAHGLPLSSYEVLMYLDDADGRPHAHARPRGVGPPQPLAASPASSTASSARASSAASRARATRAAPSRSSRRPAREMLAAARTTHLAGVRSLFLAALLRRRARRSSATPGSASFRARPQRPAPPAAEPRPPRLPPGPARHRGHSRPAQRLDTNRLRFHTVSGTGNILSRRHRYGTRALGAGS